MQKKKLLLLVVLCCTLVYVSAQNSSPETSSMKLLFVGDIMGHGPQIKSAYDNETKSYNYEPCFKYVKPIIEKADLAIGNLEVTLPGESPYRGYPMFRSPDELANAIDDAGFDVIVTSNNHSNDGALKGIYHTIDVLRSLHLHQTGTFKNEREKEVYYPLIVYKNGFKLAFLNYTYDTNGVPTPKPAIVNWIDEDEIKKDIAAAQALQADGIIVVMHWGLEYQLNESSKQRELAANIFKWGADLVIGAHPHVVQPIKETIGKDGKKEVIAYSLGNFISNQQKKNTDGGLIFEIEIKKEKGKKGISLGNHNFIPVWRYIEKKDGQTTFYSIPISAAEQENNPFQLSKSNKAKMDAFAKTTRNHLAKFDSKERKLTWNDLTKKPLSIIKRTSKGKKGYLPFSYAIGNRMGNTALATRGPETGAVSYYISHPVHRAITKVVDQDTSKPKIQTIFKYEPKGSKSPTPKKIENASKSGEMPKAIPKQYTFQPSKNPKRGEPKTNNSLPPSSAPGAKSRTAIPKSSYKTNKPQTQPQPTTQGKYTIQFQASRNLYAKSTLPFANVEIEETTTGWYRYYTGTANSLDGAKLLLQQVKAAGFSDAFITKKKYIPNIEETNTKSGEATNESYKIRFQSTQNYYNIDPKLFNDVTVFEDAKGWFVYYTGSASTLSEANDLLKFVQDKGFPGAFIVTFLDGKPKG